VNLAKISESWDKLEWFLYLLEFKLNALAVEYRGHGRRKR
jgi:hypothetical protein